MGFQAHFFVNLDRARLLGGVLGIDFFLRGDPFILQGYESLLGSGGGGGDEGWCFLRFSTLEGGDEKGGRSEYRGK